MTTKKTKKAAKPFTTRKAKLGSMRPGLATSTLGVVMTVSIVIASVVS